MTSAPTSETLDEDERPDPAPPEDEDAAMTLLGFDRPLYVLPFDHRGPA